MRRIQNLSVPCPEEIIEKAHTIYKKRNGPYYRPGGFTNKGPLQVYDNELWKDILFELKPALFHPN